MPVECEDTAPPRLCVQLAGCTRSCSSAGSGLLLWRHCRRLGSKGLAWLLQLFACPVQFALT